MIAAEDSAAAEEWQVASAALVFVKKEARGRACLNSAFPLRLLPRRSLHLPGHFETLCSPHPVHGQPGGQTIVDDYGGRGGAQA